MVTAGAKCAIFLTSKLNDRIVIGKFCPSSIQSDGATQNSII